MRISLGYPEKAEETQILRMGLEGRTTKELSPVATAEDLAALYEAYQQVRCEQPVIDYVINISNATRRSELIELGVSPRGSLALLNAARAYALLKGRDYTRPDDVQKLCLPVLLHRVRLKSQALLKRQTAGHVLRDLLYKLPVPGVKG